MKNNGEGVPVSCRPGWRDGPGDFPEWNKLFDGSDRSFAVAQNFNCTYFSVFTWEDFDNFGQRPRSPRTWLADYHHIANSRVCSSLGFTVPFFQRVEVLALPPSPQALSRTVLDSPGFLGSFPIFRWATLQKVDRS